MKDQRVAYFRGALDALVESLDATARPARWGEVESAPQPLQESAARLAERLGAANRLASGKFVGTPPVVAKLTGITGAIKRLDAAWVQYRRRIEAAPAERDEAAVALDAEIGNVKEDAGRWD